MGLPDENRFLPNLRARVKAIRGPDFRRLQSRLTVLYATMFGLTLLLIASAVYATIAANADRQVRRELESSGVVFDRLWSLRAEQLGQNASLLSRDFGFREAVATGDAATTTSAIENLRGRLKIDRAFLLRTDGAILGEGTSGLAGHADPLINAMYASDSPAGVYLLEGVPYQVVASPVLSPDLIGWVVFASRLDRDEMQSLERLASIPIKARVLTRDASGWHGTPGIRSDDLNPLVGRGHARAAVLKTDGGEAIALTKPLPSLTGATDVALLLTYPKALAFAPYQPLLVSIVVASLLGMALVMAGSWHLARSVTRPIAALDEAAHRLQRGEDGHVTVDTHDEIGRLADSFNLMATEIREREQRITHLALHDPETGLLNRLAFEKALDEARSPDLHLALFGIDRFAHVRGAIGYALAAEMVRGVGERLVSLQVSGTVARISTDVIGLAFEAASERQARSVVRRLLARLEHPLKVAGNAIDVSLSVGLYPLGKAGANLALERANIALDQARAAGQKTASFDEVLYGDPASNLALMSGMLKAIRSGHIELFHQPKFDLRSRTVNAAEGLVRWRHPSRGMLRPDLFIPMAEETGHIRTLTDWVLKQAVQDQQVMRNAGQDLEVAINISGRVLGDPGFAELVDRTLEGAEGQICFEITETAVIENPDLAFQNLERFRNAGVKISIDDFGSGLSSLAYLKQIKGHELKIDRSLIIDVTESQRDALIVRSTIDLAHSLGLKVTAEGVELPNTFQLLAAMGCDSIQGYLIARPQSLPDLIRSLSEDRPELAIAS